MTLSSQVQKLVDALTLIARQRRKYNGLPCKNLAADIADEAIADAAGVVGAIRGMEKQIEEMQACHKQVMDAYDSPKSPTLEEVLMEIASIPNGYFTRTQVKKVITDCYKKGNAENIK